MSLAICHAVCVSAALVSVAKVMHCIQCSLVVSLKLCCQCSQLSTGPGGWRRTELDAVVSSSNHIVNVSFMYISK